MWQSQSLEFSSSSIFLESSWVDTKLEKCIWYYIAPNTKKTTILKCGTTKSTTFAVFWWFSTRRSISWFIALEMNSLRYEVNSVTNYLQSIWKKLLFCIGWHHWKTTFEWFLTLAFVRDPPLSLQFSNEYLCISRRSFAIYSASGVVKGYVQKEFLLNLLLWSLMKLKAMEQKCWQWKFRSVQVVSLYSLSYH